MCYIVPAMIYVICIFLAIALIWGIGLALKVMGVAFLIGGVLLALANAIIHD